MSNESDVRHKKATYEVKFLSKGKNMLDKARIFKDEASFGETTLTKAVKLMAELPDEALTACVGGVGWSYSQSQSMVINVFGLNGGSNLCPEPCAGG